MSKCNHLNCNILPLHITFAFHIVLILSILHETLHEQPLTANGAEQARALGRSLSKDLKFWRIYASDLSRTQQTLRAILDTFRGSLAHDSELICSAAATESANNKLADDTEKQSSESTGNDASVPLSSISQVRLDPRLREVAKGVFQGLPKGLTETEALRERERLGWPDPIPFKETVDEVWERVSEWFWDVIMEAKTDSATSQTRSILVVSHSGALRVFLERLLGRNRIASHPNARYDPRDSRLIIPNTSLTILQVDLSALSQAQSFNSDILDASAIEVLKFADIKHYESMEIFQVNHR